MLANRIAVRDQRRREGAHDDDEQNEKPKRPAPVPQQPRHGVALARTRGSTHAASTSAIMLPATTRTALIAVAAITTG